MTSLPEEILANIESYLPPPLCNVVICTEEQNITCKLYGRSGLHAESELRHCHGSAANDVVPLRRNRLTIRRCTYESWAWAHGIARQINNVLLALLDAHRHRSSRSAGSAACPMKVELRSNAVLEADEEFPLHLEAWADEGRKEYSLKLKTWGDDSTMLTLYERTHPSNLPEDDDENYAISNALDETNRRESWRMSAASAGCGGRGELFLKVALKEVITTGLWIQCTCDFIPSSEATLWNCWNAPRRKDIPVKLGFRHLDVVGGLRTHPSTRPSTTIVSSTKREIAQEEGERRKRRRAWLSFP